MKALKGTQNGHKRSGSRFSRYESWQDIPVDVLREFTDELRLRYTDRGVSKIAGLSATAVQDFVKGRTQPERRTLRAFGELYLEFVPFAYEKVTVQERVRLPGLKSVLPDGEKAALDYIDAVIRGAEIAGDLPQPPGPLREWLRFLVEAEYQFEAQYKQYLRKRRLKRGKSDELPRRKRKKRPDSDPE